MATDALATTAVPASVDGDITHLLRSWQDGNADAFGQLVRRMHHDFRAWRPAG